MSALEDPPEPKEEKPPKEEAAPKRMPKPRNPRHFGTIEGGRQRVSDTFTHKNSGSCYIVYRGAQPLFHALFWRQNTV